MQSTDTKPKRLRKRALPQALLINTTASVYSQSRGRILERQSDMLNTFLKLEERSNYSADIKLKDLSGILRITWIPGESRPATQQRRRNSAKNSTFAT